MHAQHLIEMYLTHHQDVQRPKDSRLHHNCLGEYMSLFIPINKIYNNNLLFPHQLFSKALETQDLTWLISRRV